MTDEQKFIFDLEGYIVIQNVLSDGEVAELNAIVDRRLAEGDGKFGRPSLQGAAFQGLMDHPNIVPYLIDLLGPKVRIDHDYAIFMKKGEEKGRLHGGPVEHEPDHWYRYRDGVIRNGLTVFSYFTAPCRTGDGGFACIPGSHKTNFLRNVPDDVRAFKRRAHYVRQPPVEAGDVLIFTEALIHGTMPWAADHQRRSFLYKYSPGHSAWNQNYYDPADYPTATEQQIRLMAAPSVGRRPDTFQTIP